ncbi:BRO family protein [Erysipelothrix anatis]|uniref:BRO family protein n=1 Tax=Erysipelothrix anatis TaxID=2683713 RepID=UPI0013594585|nr:ORF6C domain-containing protein [Erysipelothrix anatis]
MNDLQVIKETEVLNKNFKIYGNTDNPLFLAKDVAEWIEYDLSSVNKLVNMVDEDEKVRKNVPTLGGVQEAWFLTEDGLYEVLMQSRKPIAKQFKKQIKIILKELRLGNQIMIPTNPMEALELMIKVQKDTSDQIESIDNRVVELEENVLLSPGEYNLIGRKVNSRVRVVAKDRQISSERNVLSELFKAINNDVNKVARVRTRAQIKQKDFDVVFDLINVWEPSQATMHVVRELEKGE